MRCHFHEFLKTYLNLHLTHCPSILDPLARGQKETNSIVHWIMCGSLLSETVAGKGNQGGTDLEAARF